MPPAACGNDPCKACPRTTRAGLVFRPGGVQGKMKAHIEEKIFAVPAGSLPGKKCYIMK